MVYEITPESMGQEGTAAVEAAPLTGPEDEEPLQDDAASVPADTRSRKPKRRRGRKPKPDKTIDRVSRDELLEELWERLEKKPVDTQVDLGDGKTVTLTPSYIKIVRDGDRIVATMAYKTEIETEVEL